jgi:hypothetical protein
VRWYQVLDLLQFFFSLINIATIVPFAILTGLGFVHPYRALSMGLISIVIFNVVSLPAMYLLRRRGGLASMPANRLWRTRFGAAKAIFAQFALGISFIGCSLAVMGGALAHILNRPLVFSETSVDALGQVPRRAHLRSPALRNALRDGGILLAICAALAGWQFYLNLAPDPNFEPLDWRYHAVWLYPLVLNAFAPFFFHPYLVGGPDLPKRLAKRRSRGASEAPVVPKTRKRTASRRRGAA